MYRHPPLSVVDGVPKAWSIDYCEPQLDTFLFYIHSGSINAHSLTNTLCREREGDISSNNTNTHSTCT